MSPKKEFSLSGILKIRKYNEQLAMQVFAKETEEDRVLANRYARLQADIDTTLTQIDVTSRMENNLQTMRDMYDYISLSQSKLNIIQSEREKLKEKIQKAREAYNKVRLELESIKILENKHIEKIKKEAHLEASYELQERVLWQEYSHD